MRSATVLLLLLLATCVRTEAQDRRAITRDDAPARRLALVIGNDRYPGAAALTNARNDARAMSAALRALSFEVTTIEDGTRSAIVGGLLEFGRRVTASDLAMIFYAGHGVQVEGVNYAVPVEFSGRTEDEVRVNAISTDEFTRTLSRARVGVLVLDACRDNPYSGQRSGGRGLAQLEAKGMIVAFATGAGQTASDGVGAANGVFTSELVKLLGAPGRGLRDTFFEVQSRVTQATNGRQFPAVYSQLINDVVLTPAAAAVSPLPGPTGTELALRAELELWDAIKTSTNPAVFRDYLDRYPSGQFRAAAEDRVRILTAPPASGPAPSPGTGATPFPRTPSSTSIAPVAIRASGALQKAEQIQAVALADRFMAAPASASDFRMRIEPYFLKSQDATRTFVPFVLHLDTVPANDSVLYVRVVPQGGGVTNQYPWDDIDVVNGVSFRAPPSRLTRVFMTSPGTYDVYVTLIERGSVQPGGLARIGLLKQQVTVPNFLDGRFAISSLLVTDSVNMLGAPLSPAEARTRPFVFGTQELNPAADLQFNKREELTIFFQVYNAGLDGSGKPNVTLEYEFFRQDGGGEKFFNKTSPQTVNASSLPPAFDAVRFPLPGGVGVPLASFASGNYRLNVRVTDKTTGRVITQDAVFTVVD
ncbi:MAG TPA: caspase family protein [Vicinamibacterales bacterium]|nr:caspase family protein [Vicinamibacterales bacterium]